MKLKRLVLLAVAALSFSANAEERTIYDDAIEAYRPVSNIISNELTKFTDALVYDAYGVKPGAAAQRRNDPTRMRVTRSVKECIKPNNVMDDDVQRCVNGTLEKTW